MIPVLFLSCHKMGGHQSVLNEYNLVPLPAELKPKGGRFQVSGDTKILLLSNDEGLKTAASQLASVLIKATGTTVAPVEASKQKDAFLFSLDPTIENDEGYRLSISPQGAAIQAKTGAGAFYAVQTLRQLMPAGAEEKATASFSIPCAEISDAPRYSYRGMHLDVCRHFFGVDFVKKYIDQLALHKFNRFHWHLTDDQGWRLEIKKYPKLRELASCRDETLVGHYFADNPQYDGQQYCGFYTQEEAREIVRYAAERFITVIPEIEMPGHAQAAIAAYPELGCTGRKIPVLTKWGVSENVFCPNEVTFEFLENVLTEVMDIFPSKYIHIGGDECPKTQWEQSQFCQDLIKRENLKDEDGLQSYFIHRMEKFLNSKGRQIIGWDEILEGGLAPNATVMSWQGMEGGIAAARQRHDVIMTPVDFCYLDYYQSDDPEEPLSIGGHLPLDKVYSFNPDPIELTPEEQKHILGLQGNLWTEYIAETQHLEYMAFPRACAIAEIGWTPQALRNYDHFISRLSKHIDRLEAMGLNVARKIYDVKTKVASGGGDGVSVSLSPKMSGLDLRYSTDGSTPTMNSTTYTGPFAIEKSCTLRAGSFRNGKPAGKEAALIFNMHKAAGKSILLAEQPAPKYSGNGSGSIVNGVLGPDDHFGDPEWLGFQGKDLDALISLGREMDLSSVNLRFFNGKKQWIYPPREVMVLISNDGLRFREVAIDAVQDSGEQIISTRLRFPNTKGSYLKVQVKRYGVIPEGAPGGGHEAWLFVDELVVE